MKNYHLVTIRKEIDVCVLADTNEAAQELSRESDFDWDAAPVAVVACLQDDFYDDPDLIDEFKLEERYAE